MVNIKPYHILKNLSSVFLTNSLISKQIRKPNSVLMVIYLVLMLPSGSSGLPFFDLALR